MSDGWVQSGSGFGMRPRAAIASGLSCLLTQAAIRYENGGASDGIATSSSRSAPGAPPPDCHSRTRFVTWEDRNFSGEAGAAIGLTGIELSGSAYTPIPMSASAVTIVSSLTASALPLGRRLGLVDAQAEKRVAHVNTSASERNIRTVLDAPDDRRRRLVISDQVARLAVTGLLDVLAEQLGGAVTELEPEHRQLVAGDTEQGSRRFLARWDLAESVVPRVN